MQGLKTVNGSSVDTTAIEKGELFTLPSSSQVPAITANPPVISSKDVSGSFNSNVDALAAKTTPAVTPTVPIGPAGQETKRQDTQLEQTTKDQNKQKGVNETSGNPLFDSVEADRKAQQDEIKQQESDRIEVQRGLLTTGLALIDKTYQSTINNVMATYEASRSVQERINKLNISRTKAYGLGTGDALRAPIEYTNAVSQRETEAAAKINALDTARNAAIFAAEVARDKGEFDMLQNNMDKINDIEDQMRTSLNQVANEATSRLTLLTKINEQQMAEQKEQSTKALAEMAFKYSGEFDKADDTKKDSIIKSIIAQNPGISYGEVYASLQKVAQDKTDASYKTKKNAVDLANANLQNTKLLKEINNPKSNMTEAQSTKQDANTVATQLSTRVDDNGYLSPSDYKKARKAWVSAGYTAKDFDSRFAQDYVDPEKSEEYNVISN